MSNTRRHFLKKLSYLSGISLIGAWLKPSKIHSNALKSELCIHNNIKSMNEEAFWMDIRGQFNHTAGIINLNNGGVSPHPISVQTALEKYHRQHNALPAEYLLEQGGEKRDFVRRKLADFLACDAEEVAITRNTTEAMDHIIFGLPLQKGDEVVISNFDYPNTANAWKQREEREGIAVKQVDLKLPSDDEAYLVKAFEEAFSPRTKLVMITHIINWNGQILPVKKIAEIAHNRGIEVLIDAAHSFAQLDVDFSEIPYDYLGTSLHKWLCAPFGTGLLHIRKEKIRKIFPLYAPYEWTEKDDIRKFETSGTRSLATEQAIADAIDFHNKIGGARKQSRLRFLKQYWVQRVQDLPNLQFYTNLAVEQSCALCAFGLEGFGPERLYKTLKNRYGIHTAAIYHSMVPSVRITPHVYTSLEELDIFAAAVKELAEG